jgi:hypothetical protein
MVIVRASISASTVTRFRALSPSGPESRRIGWGPRRRAARAVTAAAAMSAGAMGTSGRRGTR